MKKVFLMLAVAAGCAMMTSCKSDAEKVAELTAEGLKAALSGDMDKASECDEKIQKIMEKHQDDPDFQEEVAKALLKGDK